MAYVYSIYFAAFVALAVAIAVCPKPKESFRWVRHLRLLLLFAILHGLNELVSFALWRQESAAWLLPVAALLGTSSFLALLRFGVAVATDGDVRPLLRIAEAALVLSWAAATLFADDRMLANDVFSHLLLAGPGSLIAAWAFLPDDNLQRRADAPAPLTRVGPLVLGLVVYAVASGVVVPAAPYFPASWINTDAFAALFGFPVQLLRAAAAVTIAGGLVGTVALLQQESLADLAESEARYRTLVEHSPIGVAVIQDGTFVHMNRRGLETLGAERPEQVIGTELKDWIDHPSRPSFDEIAIAKVPDSQRHPSDERMMRMDGVPIDVMTGTASMSYGGRPAVQLVFEDVSERKMQEAELERHRASLETQVEERTAHLEEALANVKTLSGMLPLCAWCRRLRDDDGYWAKLEEYVVNHTDAQITHGICPDCASKLEVVTKPE